MSQYNINTGINNGQLGDNYTIHTGNELGELSSLFLQIQSIMDQANITTEEREEADEYLDIIKKEAEQNNPRKHLIKIACEGLKKTVSSPIFWNFIDRIFAIIQK